MSSIKTVGAALIAAAAIFNAAGKTFYIDPAAGSPGNDGSFAHPWKTLQGVIDSNMIQTRAFADNPYQAGDTLTIKNQGAPVGPGDTLLLYSGYHGDISIESAQNAAPITIAAAPGQSPRVNHLLLSGACNWVVNGLSVSASFDTVGHNRDLLFINSDGWPGPSRQVTVENCSLYTVKDASAWTANQWGTYACTGANLDGTGFTFRNNAVSNVNVGIRVSADSCLVENNRFENFSDCGIRLWGTSNCSFIHNTVSGFHMVDNVFGIGFQGYSPGSTGKADSTVMHNITLTGNTIVNALSTSQPLKGPMYGIACFNGLCDNWTVENNVVLTNTWYGIAFDGAHDCRIINNTVCRLDTSDATLPCITVSDSFETTGARCVLRNNFCGAVVDTGDSTNRDDHNITAYDPDSFFIKYGQQDLRLKPGCAAVDSGSPILAPDSDIVGTVRPQGAGVDIGAYEYVLPASTISPLFPREFPAPRLIASFNRVTGSITAHIEGAPAASRQKGYTFAVFDALGKQCGRITGPGMLSIRWSGPTQEFGFSPGLYVVRAQSAGSVITARVMAW